MKTKKCKSNKYPEQACGIVKPIDQFGGGHSMCKACRQPITMKINKERYEANKEEILAEHKEYRDNHKDERREYNRQYRQDHLDERKTYDKNYREGEGRKERAKEYQREWYQEKRAEELKTHPPKPKKLEDGKLLCSAKKGCGEYKRPDDFNLSTTTIRGYTTICKECLSKLGKTEEGQIKQKTRTLMKDHGLTLDDYLGMLETQHGVCAICSTKEAGAKRKWLLVDHNHFTGQTRGLVCHTCNVLLGAAKDNIHILDRAKEYLLNNDDNSLNVAYGAIFSEDE